MKALSIMQPWASLIVGGPLAEGRKGVENRTWHPPAAMIGQRFAIHASKKQDTDAYLDLPDVEWFERAWFPYRTPREFPTSSIVGVATLDFVVADGAVNPRYKLDRVERSQRRWFSGPVGFVLADVRAIAKPVPCKGALGFWRLPDDVERQVVEQLR